MAETTPGLEGKRVLLVDDEPDVLAMLEDILDMCRLSKASTFEEAKKLLKTNEFDMAVLDIMGVDGYKLLELANRRKVIAVMLTAHALSPANAVKSRKKGAASYIPKDKINEVPEVLNEILRAKEQDASLWSRWHDRFGAYFERRFGSEWLSEGERLRESHVGKWEKYF